MPMQLRTRERARPLAPRTRTLSLAQAFDPTSNALNAIRLALAVIVVVSHSWPVTGRGDDPLLGAQDWGDWAVGGFFAISGYLITASRDTTPSFAIFVWKRFLRIYPAFLSALIAVAFIAAPLSTILTDVSWNAADSLQYVWRNSFLLITQPAIGSTLNDSPIPDSWNNPLWTLAYESACYLLIGILFTLLPSRFRLGAIAGAGLVCSVATALALGDVLSVPAVVLKGFHLGSFFAAGAFLYLGRRKIPMRRVLFISSVSVLVLAVLLRIDAVLAPLPLAFLLLWGGTKLPLRKVGAKNDISYGMYIYAFPVQQLLHLALPSLSMPLLFAVMSAFLTLPLAWLSYRFIEKPSLRLKTLWTVQTRAVGG